MRHFTFALALASVLASAGSAHAQQDAFQPEDPGYPGDPQAPDDQPLPAEDEVATPEGSYEEGAVTEETQADLEAADIDMDSLAELSRLDISGYVQPELRYEHSADDDSFYFQLRRGRLKVTYDLEPALFLVQIDATEEGVDLKDAYAGLELPMPEGVEATVLAGLFNIPFGFDLQYSSSRRVFPERSQMVRRLFPGERDLGVRLDATLVDMVDIQVAVQNGVPLGDDAFGEFDQADSDDYKDGILRVTVSPLEELTVGASGLYGVGTRRGLEMDDPATPEDESAEFDFPRYAVGGELRYQRELGSLGTFDLYGELTYAHNLARKAFGEYPANEDAETDVLAWYAAVVQDLGELFAAGARFQQYAVQDGDTQNILTLVGMALPADGTRLTLAWDFDLEDTANHEGWLRMQVKF